MRQEGGRQVCFSYIWQILSSPKSASNIVGKSNRNLVSEGCGHFVKS